MTAETFGVSNRVVLVTGMGEGVGVLSLKQMSVGDASSLHKALSVEESSVDESDELVDCLDEDLVEVLDEDLFLD
jgi:hypothetical protein